MRIYQQTGNRNGQENEKNHYNIPTSRKRIFLSLFNYKKHKETLNVLLFFCTFVIEISHEEKFY